MTASENRVKRAIYRANYRGTKELDILLGRFANSEASGLSDQAFDAFEELLALPDPQIDQWIKGETPPPGVAGIITRIRQFHGLES
jgi:antitoxin CptB